jgi:hypothetical protein
MDAKNEGVVLIGSRHYSPIACHAQPRTVTHESGTMLSTAEHAQQNKH